MESCGVGHRHDLDLALLWLWCKLAAVALIRLLAWEPPYAPYAPGVALKDKKTTTTNNHNSNRRSHLHSTCHVKTRRSMGSWQPCEAGAIALVLPIVYIDGAAHAQRGEVTCSASHRW